MTYFFNNLKNNIDFFLRNHINFSRSNYKEIPEDLSKIFMNSEQKDLCNSLEKIYDFSILKPSTKNIFLQNIYFLSIFDNYFSKSQKSNISVLDIGSKNWEYVKSEYVFFKFLTKNLCLNGIELDAFRVCTNFYNRYEIANFYKKGLLNTNYIVGDFLKHTKKYDYIIWILPFITEYPLVKWGLPLRYFKPEKMLLHAYDLLNKNGELLIINQGETEYSIQKILNEKVNISAEYLGEIKDNFKLFKNKRYCCKICKR